MRMNKLKDLIALSCSDIAIMNGVFEVLIIDVSRIDISYLSEELLNSEIDKIEAKDGYIKVWLKENKND